MTYTTATVNQAAETREIKAAMRLLTGRAFTVVSGGGISTRDQIIVQSTPARTVGRMSSTDDMLSVQDIFGLASRPVGQFRIMPDQRTEALRRLREKVAAHAA